MSGSPSESEKIGLNHRMCRLLKKLHDLDMLENLLKKLDEHRLTKDFMFSLQKMASGELPIDSIPHLAHLDSVRFKHLKDSRRMHYSKKMKRFWHCLYKVGGGPPIRLLSGPKGTGENNYDPISANINFAIPSSTTFHRFSQSNHTAIPPGVFHPILESISSSIENAPKEFILSFDGKAVGPGLKEACEGDVDLWNFEIKPNLNEEKQRLMSELEFVKELETKFRKKIYQILEMTCSN